MRRHRGVAIESNPLGLEPITDASNAISRPLYRQIHIVMFRCICLAVWKHPRGLHVGNCQYTSHSSLLVVQLVHVPGTKVEPAKTDHDRKKPCKVALPVPDNPTARCSPVRSGGILWCLETKIFATCPTSTRLAVTWGLSRRCRFQFRRMPTALLFTCHYRGGSVLTKVKHLPWQRCTQPENRGGANPHFSNFTTETWQEYFKAGSGGSIDKHLCASSACTYSTAFCSRKNRVLYCSLNTKQVAYPSASSSAKNGTVFAKSNTIIHGWCHQRVQNLPPFVSAPARNEQPDYVEARQARCGHGKETHIKPRHQQVGRDVARTDEYRYRQIGPCCCCCYYCQKQGEEGWSFGGTKTRQNTAP